MIETSLGGALPAMLAAAALAGLVRGFSGFGAAMVFVPIVSALRSPQDAVVLLFLIDAVAALPLLPGGLSRCAWREVLPLALGATICMPLGVALLKIADPDAMRWTVSLMILAAIAVLASGWRYRAVPSFPTTTAVGGLAGFTSGLAGMAGPPIVLFMLGGPNDAGTVRANIVVFFALSTLVGAAAYLAHGMITRATLLAALLLLPGYALGVRLGARSFGLASPDTFRRAAYLICGTAALLAMPFW